MKLFSFVLSSSVNQLVEDDYKTYLAEEASGIVEN
jgi:hypothetical protein